jgi:hypothetical protein
MVVSYAGLGLGAAQAPWLFLFCELIMHAKLSVNALSCLRQESTNPKLCHRPSQHIQALLTPMGKIKIRFSAPSVSVFACCVPAVA